MYWIDRIKQEDYTEIAEGHVTSLMPKKSFTRVFSGDIFTSHVISICEIILNYRKVTNIAAFLKKSKAYGLRMFCNYNYILLVWSSKIFFRNVKMYNVSSSWTKSLLNCIWFSIYKQRTKFKSTVEYGNFEIHRKDCLRLTFIHWSHVILRHCRVIYIVCIDWTNGAEHKWGRIWTIILPTN